ncbi:MAG TPA: AI-2E family transporter [Clostridiales bacterium]|nr:AI-2E family transporter [Clostridiales bacterium]
MKIKSDQFKNAIILITFGVVLIWALENLNNLWTVLLVLLSIASPFMIGIAIAFVMNVPMRFFEKTILKRLRQNIKRPISYIITLFLFVFIIFITLFIVVPELYKSFQELVNRAPQAWNNFLNWFETTALIENEYIAKFIKDITIDWKDIEQKGINLLSARASDWLLSTFSIATSVLGTIISIVLGFVFSIYILLQKEKLISQVKRISIALFPRCIHRKLVYLADLTNKSFSSFLSGQLLEAIIIGTMFFIAMKIFNFPFALVISVLIAITSFIPIVGAFIGATVGTLLILVEDVQMGFWFLVMFLIIQQIEGNLIYPNVAGKTVGLPSIWVLVAITIGGSLFGILGIILFVPLGNILYTLIKEFVENRLRVKNVSKVDYDKY